MPTNYPAGWYPDVNYPGYERFFDGSAWTHYTRAAAAQPTQALPQDAQPYPQPYVPTQAYPSEHIGSAPAATQAPGVHLGHPVAPDAHSQPTKNKGAKVPLIISGSVVGAFILVIVLGVAALSGTSGNNRPNADRPTAVQTPTPSPTPEATAVEEPAPQAVEEAPPAPPAPDGSVTNPFPAPYTVSGLFGGERYAFSGKVVNADANASVKEWNMFNDDAPAGYKYVIAEVTMTGLDPDGTEPTYDQYDVQLATAEGNGYDNEIIVFPEGTSSYWDGPTLYPGQSFTGLMAFIVPADATAFLFKVNGDYVALAG
ncbi:DUF2510 domain-containing protein [Microbacterium sp. p3-SID338]|uniref:DUF2510 domain-containing protein n=1 Tax=Microbacterium sp. p3-SID338 TaxID=2916214 RepID=UPI0021A5F834|nr:DUF2510 domain-containing protein [Microbacterium sp. p3-SID338]MCT1394673.1 DUF2510 domain-containing protein [Microbacterium sp. p3-SID338]